MNVLLMFHVPTFLLDVASSLRPISRCAAAQREDPVFVKSISPIQQNSIKNGYDENNNYNKSDETKCATNYSFFTNNNKWNVNTHDYMQLTKHDTNDGVDFDNCVVHTVR